MAMAVAVSASSLEVRGDLPTRTESSIQTAIAVVAQVRRKPGARHDFGLSPRLERVAEGFAQCLMVSRSLIEFQVR
jgi:hypothetical protein